MPHGAKTPPLTEAHRALVEGYLREWDPLAVLIRLWPSTYHAARASRLGPDEIRQAATVGVVEAAPRYDPAFGASFATYAGHHVRRAVQEAIGRNPKATLFRGRMVSGDAPVNDDDTVWDLEGTVPSEAEAAAEAGELRGRVAAVLRTLHPRLREVLELRHGLDGNGERTLEEVSAALGVTRERVRQLESKAAERVLVPLQLACGDLVGGRPVRPGDPRPR